MGVVGFDAMKGKVRFEHQHYRSYSQLFICIPNLLPVHLVYHLLQKVGSPGFAGKVSILGGVRAA